MDSSDDNDIIVIESSDDDGGSSASGNDNVASAHRSEQQFEHDDSIADEMDLTLQSFLAERSPARETHHPNNEMNDDIIDVDADQATYLSIASSSSSSSSSGLPGPSPFKNSSTHLSHHRPPSVIHTAANFENKKDNGDVHGLSEVTAVPVSSNTSNNTRDNNKTAAMTKSKAKTKTRKPGPKRNNAKSRKRAAKLKTSSSASVNSDSAHTTTTKTTTSSSNNNNHDDEEDPTATKHFHCYLLRSLNPDHPLKTYIGFTTNPSRRIRQHNGILKAGGANKTKRAGRPWTFVAIIHGFQDKITALQFEWAWQNVDKSKAFREAVGDDALARKMKRRMGPKARLDELRWLLKDVQPFCLYSLTVYFPERTYYEIFRGIVSRGKSGNPYKKDDDESTCRSEMLDSLLDIQVSAVEDMPFAKEIVELKEKKKALRRRKKEERQAAKKRQKDANAAVEYSSDISSWLETLDGCDDDVDNDVGSWSDLLDESDDNDKEVNTTQKDRRDLSAIEEDDNSCVLSIEDWNDMRKETASSTKQKRKGLSVDDISSTLQSLSMDGVSKMKADDVNNDENDECDFSTISSADSESSNCFMKSGGNNDIYKENYEANKLTETPAKNCDFFDLCSP